MRLYHPLESGQFRALKLEPRTSNGSSRLEFSLHTFSLVDHPPFKALSYTWGPPLPKVEAVPTESDSSNSTRTIWITTDPRTDLVEWAYMQVQPNLYDFLNRYAQLEQDTEDYIWVDALCINQHDESERSEQVMLMAKLYQAAMGVIIWLGDSDLYTAKAFALLEHLDKTDRAAMPYVHPQEISEDAKDVGRDRSHWAALAQLFLRSWFRRAWIWQEVIFAKSATVMCGTYRCSWHRMANICGFLATSNWKNYLFALDPSTAAHDSFTDCVNMPTRLRASQKDWQSSAEDALLHALIRSRTSLCQDPRDKIYSQIHLGRASIIPDYTTSTADVYTRAAEYILMHSDSLYLLACVEGEDFQQVPGLPSWVPDWSVTTGLGLKVTGYKDFHASGQRQRYCKFLQEGTSHVLQVEAAELDVITEAYGTKSDLRELKMLLLLLQSVGTSRDPVYFTEQSREEVLWRTLVTNRARASTGHGVQYPAHHQLASSFRAWILWRIGVDFLAASTDTRDALLQTTHPYLKLGSGILRNGILPSVADVEQLLTDLGRDGGEGVAKLTEIEHLASPFELHYSHAMHLRPFVTKKGFLGISTTSLRIGDVVHIVSGSRVPLILRKIPDNLHWRLVGGSYVHGAMVGQALRQKDVDFRIVSLI